MTNDPLVKVTHCELAAILNTRRRAFLPVSYPATVPGVRMHPSGRLWWVAEFGFQAIEAERAGDSDLAESWKARARGVAARVAAVAAREGNCERLCEVAAALVPQRPEPPARTPQQRVLSAVGAFCATYGRNPTQREVREFAKKQKVILRVEDVSEVMRDKFKPGKRGRKSI